MFGPLPSREQYVENHGDLTPEKLRLYTKANIVIANDIANIRS
jgi:hypothetical protein